MPIRLNLLAEAHAEEDLRRRDPVKRALWIGAGVLALMLAWSSSLQLQAMVAKGSLNRFQSQLAARTNEYAEVLDNQKKLADARTRLSALQQLAANRFLQGSLLSALQQVADTNVDLVRFRSTQTYDRKEGAKGKPTKITENIVLTLEAKDVGASPGDGVTVYKEAIFSSPFFREALPNTNSVRLTNLSPVQNGPDGKPFLMFTVECRYPEKTR